MTHVDLATNSRIDDPGALAGLFSTSRRLHEALILDLRWLVTASTAAMLVLVGLGVAMGWPRIRNNLSGWHKGTAWLLLPLVVLSPLTGLLMALGVTFAGAPAATTSVPTLPMAEAVRIVAADHDLATVSWIRPRGNALLARLDDDGEMRVFRRHPRRSGGDTAQLAAAHPRGQLGRRPVRVDQRRDVAGADRPLGQRLVAVGPPPDAAAHGADAADGRILKSVIASRRRSDPETSKCWIASSLSFPAMTAAERAAPTPSRAPRTLRRPAGQPIPTDPRRG